MNAAGVGSSDAARATWWFAFSRQMCFVFLRVFYRIRRSGSHHIPAKGPVLIVANHQSYLDPPIVGVMCMHRALHFVARVGLFENRFFSWLITSYNSIPIRENTGDIAAMKEAIRRLDRGAAVLIFPEGSRTEDGSMTEFKRGVSILLKRATCPVVPIAIEGAFESWPRGRKWPRLLGARIAARAAPAIPHDELLKDGTDAALRRLESIIDGMRLELRAELRAHTGGKFPPAGRADAPSYSSSVSSSAEPGRTE
ncbi:MAG: 1-acyl-sn-glycerol-3-phosphate acyltransferase [Phycisphaeraceae bacterium]|nr:1-acyl-sn-glycerol-3-phosphate acyltransferase [Phycisphaerales bacterium]MCB9843041.1 1-acyl-sn-glycerol-3-phosphate acyltransferase [Phycisphaeraceae bacterium]